MGIGFTVLNFSHVKPNVTPPKTIELGKSEIYQSKDISSELINLQGHSCVIFEKAKALIYS